MAEPGCPSLTLSATPELSLEVVVALIWVTQNLSLGVEQDMVWKVSLPWVPHCRGLSVGEDPV